MHVELQRADSQNWVTARAGDRIETDTIISTGFRSTAILTVGNSTLTVKPITRLSLSELVSENNTDVTSINLNTGRVRAEVRPPAGGRASFSVQTTTATASVRGTIFEMDTASIRVLEGSVGFAGKSGNRTVIVNSGESTIIDIETNTVLSIMAVAEAERMFPALHGESAFSRINSGRKFVIFEEYGSIELPDIKIGVPGEQ